MSMVYEFFVGKWVPISEDVYRSLCKSMPDQCRSYPANTEKIVKALRNLLHLKEWKDKHGKDHHYEQFQPEAWSYAKEALEDLADAPYDEWKLLKDENQKLRESYVHLLELHYKNNPNME